MRPGVRTVVIGALLTAGLAPETIAGTPSSQGYSFTLFGGWARHPERPLTLTFDGTHCVLDGVLFRGTYDKGGELIEGAQSRTKLLKLDSFTLKQAQQDYKYVAVSDTPLPAKGLGEFPQINFYLPEADAGVFTIRYKEAAINGAKFDRFEFECRPMKR